MMFFRKLIALAALCGAGVAHGQIAPMPAGSGTQVTAAGVPSSYSSSLAAIAAKQGVLIDTFKQIGDADDTALFTRAASACVPIVLGARTYSVSQVSWPASCINFVAIGVPGISTIQRNALNSGSFFGISSANVFINGVTFDMNASGLSGSGSASQWGVFLGQGGQNIAVHNSLFENNAGSLGCGLCVKSTGPSAGGSFSITHNQFINNTWNQLYLASVSNGVVEANYISGTTFASGISASAYGAASISNYSTTLNITGNTVIGGTTGLAIGGYGPPYTFSPPPITNSNITGNIVQDSSVMIGLQGDYLTFSGNTVFQSSNIVSVSAGMYCNGRYANITNNNFNMINSGYAIDCGGGLNQTIKNNTVYVQSGSALNIGGTINTDAENNSLFVSGTATAVGVFAIEGDGGGNYFPTITSNLIIKNNDITMAGSSSRGIQIFDGAGGFAGALPTQITNNNFAISSGASLAYALQYFTPPGALSVQGNTQNGINYEYVDPNGSGDVIVDNIMDQVVGYSSTVNIRAIVNNMLNNFNAGTSIIYVIPTAGGTGYTIATTLSVTSGGCTGYSLTPEIYGGAIIGVRVNNKGTGCSGTITVAATDSGGGTGATFSVGKVAYIPAYKQISYYGFGNLLVGSGGAISWASSAPPIQTRNGSPVNLSASSGGSFWYLNGTPAYAQYTVAGLPTCNAAAKYSWAYVTDATAPTYNGALVGGGTVKVQVQCNSTSWVSM